MKPSKRAQAMAVKAMAEQYGMDKPDGIPGLPDPTTEHIAELGRWLVHEGSKGLDMEWNAVVCYAVCILEIAWRRLGEKVFFQLSDRNNPTVRISQALYRKEQYWVADPVIEDFMGNNKAIRDWLKKVGMWRKWR